MKTRIFFALFLLLLWGQLLHAQSTEIRPGIILPQMTSTQRTALSATNGMLVFDTNTQSYWLRSSGAWTELPKTAANTNFWQQTGAAGNEIKNTNSGGFWSANPTGLDFNTGSISNPPTAPVSGAGTRLMWIPARSAFRVGTISDNRWDAAEIGLFSFASGLDSKANGYASTALGTLTSANGLYSSAIGFHTIANGDYSTAIGYYTTANEHSSIAMGALTTASKYGSTAMGINTTANGNASTAMGYNSYAGGLVSTAIGNETIASGESATAMGRYNTDNPNAIFMVGNGTSSTARVNVFTIRGDNNYVGIGTDNPIAHLHVGSYGLVKTFSLKYFDRIPTGFTGTSYTSDAADYLTSIYANHAIISATMVGAGQSTTASDIRIKNITNRSDNVADLDLLKKLQITNYLMKDEGTWGKQIFKKVIAQEVEKIYPEAVRKQTSVIPDIYALAEKVDYDANKKELSISLISNYDLKVGDKIELVHPEKGKVRTTISAVSGNSFTVKDWLYETDKIFVFGREVDDFRVVDYEALSMLGISAIQALAKQNEVLEQKVKSFENRFERIEALLNNPNIGK